MSKRKIGWGFVNGRVVLETVDKMTDCAYEEGYLTALIESGTIDDKDPLPAEYEFSLQLNLLKRLERRG